MSGNGRVRGRLGPNACASGLRLSVSWKIYDFPTQRIRAAGIVGGAILVPLTNSTLPPGALPRRSFGERRPKDKGKAAGALPPHPRKRPERPLDPFSAFGRPLGTGYSPSRQARRILHPTAPALSSSSPLPGSSGQSSALSAPGSGRSPPNTPYPPQSSDTALGWAAAPQSPPQPPQA